VKRCHRSQGRSHKQYLRLLDYEANSIAAYAGQKTFSDGFSSEIVF
jgi:hypothetical protein